MGLSEKEMSKKSTRSGKSSSKKKDNSTAPRRAPTKTPEDATTPVKTAYSPGGLSCVTAKSIRSSPGGSSTKTAKNISAVGIVGNTQRSVKSDKSGKVDQVEKSTESIFRETSQRCDQLHSRTENSLRTAILNSPNRNVTSGASTVKTTTTARSTVETPKSDRIVRLCMMKTPNSRDQQTARSPFQTAVSSTKSTRTAKESRLHERTIGGLKQGTAFGQSRPALQKKPQGVSAKSIKSTPSKTVKVPVCITPTNTAVAPPNTPAMPIDGMTSATTALSPSWLACHKTTGNAPSKTARSGQLTPVPKSMGITANSKSTRKPSAISSKASPNPVARRLFRENASNKSVKPSVSNKSNKSGKSRMSSSVDGSKKKRQAVAENSQSTESSSTDIAPREEIIWTATTADDGFSVVVRMGMTTVTKGNKEEALTTKRIVVKGEKVFGG